VNGAPIGGATAQQYIAATAGDYTVIVTSNGCSSAASAATTVTVNPIPNAAITAPASAGSGSTGNAASVANAGGGATYNWSVTGGTITAGTGTANITFTAGAPGTLTLHVTVTTAAGCSDTKSANVNVTASTSVTISSVVPPAGKITGGKDVTINGSGFQSGATVTFGGSAATNVVVVNATKITAKTPAHASGTVNVTVTNPDTSSGTLTNGYTFVPTQFDANGDNHIDPADIFYLVNYLFLGGPPPAGAAGMLSGDANGDGAVDPADIFYLVNYLFTGGPLPASEPARVSTQAVRTMAGEVTLGPPQQRDGRWFVPVNVSTAPGAGAAQALSLRVTFSGARVDGATIRRTGAGRSSDPLFEISRDGNGTLSYLLVTNGSTGAMVGEVAEIEIPSFTGATLRIAVDPALTLLGDQSGTRTATVGAGTLRVNAVSIKNDGDHKTRNPETSR
jgi:hypothetical protein